MLAYAFDPDPTKRAKARDLLSGHLSEGRFVTCGQVIQEFVWLASRKFRARIPEAELDHYLDEILLPNAVVFTDSALLADALRLHREHQVPYYDALVLASALRSGCGTLYTEDFQNGRRFGSLTIRSPFGS